MRKKFSIIVFLAFIISSLQAQTTNSNSFEGIHFPKYDDVVPNKVKSKRIKPTEIETEYYGNLPLFFNPSFGSTVVKKKEPTIPTDESYEDFIEKGLNSENLNKYLSGDFEGNGGHPALARISQYQKEISKILQVTDEEHGKSELYNQIKPSIRIMCSPVPLRANGSFVVAKNFPHPQSPTIYFDCDQFMNFEAGDQRLLVFHEVLPIIGLLDTDYELSSYLVDLALKILPAVL